MTEYINAGVHQPTTVTMVNPVTGALLASGAGFTSQVSITRPNDTTAYAAGDVVGATAAAITFASIGPAEGHIVITDADLRIDVSTIPSGMTTFRLHLYNATPTSALADNAAWDLPSTDRAAYLGYIDFDIPTDVGSTLYTQMSTLKKLKMGATSSLFGYLVTTSAFTPSASTVKSLRINAIGL